MARKALIHQIEARERRGRWFGALATLLSISLLLSGWVGLFAFLGANSAYATFEEVADEWVPETRGMALNLPDLSRVSRVYADSGEVLAELHDGRNSEPIPYEDVPELVVHAILAAEDASFFEHSGVDFSAIASAAVDNIIYDTTRGGSTITQQVVKNTFVGAEISIQRKINEAFVAAELERRFPKERILEFYMNSIYFGAGAWGVKAAADEFYLKDLDELQIHEAAALSVLIRNPSLYNPRRRPELTLERRNDVISQMAEQGWITGPQAEYAKGQPLGVVDSPARRGEADHVVAEVRRQLLNDPEFSFLGDTNEERKQAIFGCPADDVECEGGGGLQIFTTIDLELQKEANRVLNEWLPLLPYEQNFQECGKIFPDFEQSQEFYARYAETHSCRPTGAIAMVDNHTGAVIVMASGLDFEFSQFDLAIQGRRNPGSAFKPVGLVAALERGFTTGHQWAGPHPIEIECPFICSPDGTNIWEVGNATGNSTGVISLHEATYRSVNTVYAQVSLEVGPENIVDTARRMGITEARLDPVLSIVLGSSAVSPLEMASAYSNFATNGLHADDYIISRIVDHTGAVIYEKETQHTQVSDPGIFAAARKALERVPTTSGTASRANIDHPQGGKTGTHQNFYDAWYVGFTPEYSTSVWVGYEAEQIPLTNVIIKGSEINRVFGGRVPAPIWAEFMTIVTADLPESQFPEDPPNTADYMTPTTTIVPIVVGLDIEEATKRLEVGARLNVEVFEIPSLEPLGIVVRQSEPAGTELGQGETITLHVSNGEVPISELPDLFGLTVEEALVELEILELSTGVKITLVTQPTVVEDPTLVGKIVFSNPPAGTVIDTSATVIVFVAELGGGP